MYDGMPVQLTTGKKNNRSRKVVSWKSKVDRIVSNKFKLTEYYITYSQTIRSLYPPGSGFGGGAQRARYMAVRARRLVWRARRGGPQSTDITQTG